MSRRLPIDRCAICNKPRAETITTLPANSRTPMSFSHGSWDCFYCRNCGDFVGFKSETPKVSVNVGARFIAPS